MVKQSAFGFGLLTHRAACALEYEINTPVGTTLSRVVLGAYNTSEADRLALSPQ